MSRACEPLVKAILNIDNFLQETKLARCNLIFLPYYLGLAFGFAEMCRSILGFLTPLIVVTTLTGGYESDPKGWTDLFYIAFALMMLPCLLFVFLAKFEPVDIHNTKDKTPDQQGL